MEHMKYYDTYEEAKAAYPDCDAVVTTSDKWDGGSSRVVGKFCPVYKAKSPSFTWTYCEMREMSYPEIGETKWIVATPPKPTRTTYEKIEFEHAWEAVKAFEEGEEFYLSEDGDSKVSNFSELADELFNGADVYRKVEKEISWQEELVALLENSSMVNTLILLLR